MLAKIIYNSVGFLTSSPSSETFGITFFSYSTSTVAVLPIACLRKNSLDSQPQGFYSFNE